MRDHAAAPAARERFRAGLAAAKHGIDTMNASVAASTTRVDLFDVARVRRFGQGPAVFGPVERDRCRRHFCRT
jgi:hypothetical protein